MFSKGEENAWAHSMPSQIKVPWNLAWLCKIALCLLLFSPLDSLAFVWPSNNSIAVSVLCADAVNRGVRATEIKNQGLSEKVRWHELKRRMLHLSILLEIKCRTLTVSGLAYHWFIDWTNYTLSRNIGHTARLPLNLVQPIDFNLISVHRGGGQDDLIGAYCVWPGPVGALFILNKVYWIINNHNLLNY